MNKKRFIIICAAMVLVVFCLALMGCNTPEDTTPKEFIIQYTDDSGTYKITVTVGMPYALDVVPTRDGYKFVGLFDAKVGGTQYIDETGMSLSPFTDGKNLVLFPQFKANDYSIVLDYQGAQVTGERQFTVAYGDSLPQLPKNLTGEHKTFSGWYTEPNCQGVRVADQYGLIPVVSVLNNNNFDLTSELIYLYAGFEVEKYTVTCFFEVGMESEELQVEYDTPVSKIVPETRVNGKAPLTWSKTQGGEVFNGKITSETVLYALEYAPVIDFDVDGGNKVNSLVARAGTTVALPTPTKDLAKFAYWEDMQGNKYTATTMPKSSISLKAVWQGKLVFDSNGGSDVKDISEKAGTTITLPTPEREGFIFAGWYTENKEQYTSITMPVIGIKLKAGWYKSKECKIVSLSTDKTMTCKTGSYTVIKDLTIDLENFLPASFDGQISISCNVRVKYRNDGPAASPDITKFGIGFYNNSTPSDAYYLYSKVVEISSSYEKFAFSFTANLQGNKIYVACASTTHSFMGGSIWGYSEFYDLNYSISYPDTTNLYL